MNFFISKIINPLFKWLTKPRFPVVGQVYNICPTLENCLDQFVLRTEPQKMSKIVDKIWLKDPSSSFFVLATSQPNHSDMIWYQWIKVLFSTSSGHTLVGWIQLSDFLVLVTGINVWETLIKYPDYPEGL